MHKQLIIHSVFDCPTANKCNKLLNYSNMNKVPCKICYKLIHRATVSRHEKLHDKHGFEVSRFSMETINLYNEHVKPLLDELLEISKTTPIRQILCRPEVLPTYEQMFEKLTPIVECDKKGLVGLHVHFIGMLKDSFNPDGSIMTYYEQRKHYGLKGNAKNNGCAIFLENKLHICNALIYLMGPGTPFSEKERYHTQPEGLKALTTNQCNSLKGYLVKILHLEHELAELKSTKRYRLKSYIARKMQLGKKKKQFQLNKMKRELLKEQLDQGIIDNNTYANLLPPELPVPNELVPYQDYYENK